MAHRAGCKISGTALGVAAAALVASLAAPPVPASAGGDQFVEVEAPIVIETTDHSIDVDDPELIAQMEQVHDSYEPGQATSTYQAGSSAVVAGAGSGGMSVTYYGSPPADVRSVVAQAADDWDRVLAISPVAPVNIALVWADLGGSSILGAAGPEVLYGGPDLPRPDSLYPVALANTLLGGDLNGSSPELIVSLNSSVNWYTGTSGATGEGRVDLYTVALHEIAHGLGFIGSARSAYAPNHDDYQAGLSIPPFIYDHQVTYNGTSLPSVPDYNAHLTTDHLFIKSNDGLSNKIFAPLGWREGSSFSHFDEAAHPTGTCGALMTPTIVLIETARGLDAALLGIMKNIGWFMDPPPAPAEVKVSGGLSPTVSWAAPYCPGSTTYTVQRSSNGGAWTTIGITSSLSLATTVTEGIHQFRVRATDFRGAGTFGYTIPTGFSAGVVRPLALDGQLSRLYQAYFLRAPDAAGFGYWQGERAGGLGLGAISSTFASSNEFQAAYGALDDGQFVDLVYQNVLGRAADPGGRAYWISLLGAGLSRGETMTGFSESNEFVNQTGTVAPTTVAAGQVYRLYVAFFLRNPDQAGFDYWTGVRNGGASLQSIAASFASSAEFVSSYGSLTNGRFVELVYGNVLGRAPDAAGRAYWEWQLAIGLGRGDMMVGFSESAELVLTTGTLS